jgi:hypothetical protein
MPQYARVRNEAARIQHQTMNGKFQDRTSAAIARVGSNEKLGVPRAAQSGQPNRLLLYPEEGPIDAATRTAKRILSTRQFVRRENEHPRLSWLLRAFSGLKYSIGPL